MFPFVVYNNRKASVDTALGGGLMENERRSAVRVPCNLPSSFRDTDSADSWSSRFVSVKNISRGGMLLRTHTPIPLTAKLDIAFVLPNPFHKKPTEAKVAPCWVSKVQGADSYDIGVRFVDMDDEAKIAIRNSC